MAVMTIDQPAIVAMRRMGGVAGQFAMETTVRYPGEEPSSVRFVGSVYGGPVVMVTAEGHQHFVTEPGRFGEFGEAWVRRFFGGVR